MEFSIIIPTRDRPGIFDETLRAVVMAMEGVNAEVIVVNDSKSGRPAIPKGNHRIKLVDNPGQGVASARNTGAKLATSEWLIFMDDDFLVEHRHLMGAVEYARKEPNRIYLFDWTYPPSTMSSIHHHRFGRYLVKYGLNSLKGWMAGEWHDEQVFELKGGASYFFAIAKKTFDALGGYDERFPHAGAEDYDFVNRARKSGLRYYLNQGLVIFHNEKDRLDPANFLARKKRNGETIATAVKLGYAELSIDYPMIKKFSLRALSGMKPVLQWIQSVLPDIPLFDPFYFRLTNLLLAVYFFEGYSAFKR